MADQLRYQDRTNLTEGSIPHHLIRLTAPMIWGVFAIISVQLVDTYFVSLLGTEELAGLSFTFPVTLTLTHIIFGLNIAMSSVVSRLLGAGEKNEARRVVLHGLIIAAALSATIALITYIFLQPIFTAMGADPNIMPIVMDYMPPFLLGSIMLSLPVSGNSAIRAAGDSLRPALVMTTIALTNMILDPILIFGYLGSPEFGVKGAAIATMISYGVGMILGLYILIFQKKMIATDGLYLDKFKDSMKRLLFIAIPAGIANIIMPLTTAIITALLATYGTEAVAAYGVASRIEAFAMIIIIALSTGMSPIIGQNWGAKNYRRVHKTINISIGFNMVWSLAIALILGIFAEPLAALFSDDPEVIRMAKLYFWIVPFSYGIGNLIFGWSSAFNAMGQPKRAFIMIVVRAIILTVPAIYIGSWLYGTIGVFIALAAVNLVSGTAFHILSWRACHKHEEKTVNK